MRNAENLIRARRSVRTFSEAPLPAELLAEVRALLTHTENPWEVPLELRLLEAGPKGLKSPVILNETLYAAAKGPRGPYLEAAAGFVLERFCLEALELGLGTVLLGGTLNRDAFDRAMDLRPGEGMPLAAPLGFPAEKMSLRERAMRKGVAADRRLPFGEVFFDGSFDRPLTQERAGRLALPLELVRLAPSAANRQPWRAVVGEGRVVFYLRRGKLMVSERAGDMQKADLGIALCHFLLGCEAAGLRARVSAEAGPACSAADTEFFAVCSLE